jgi:hypothetical protein
MTTNTLMLQHVSVVFAILLHFHHPRRSDAEHLADDRQATGHQWLVTACAESVPAAS